MKTFSNEVSLCLVLHVFAEDDQMYFTKNPKDVSVVTGKPVTLSCEVTPSEGVTYYWEMNCK